MLIYAEPVTYVEISFSVTALHMDSWVHTLPMPACNVRKPICSDLHPLLPSTNVLPARLVGHALAIASRSAYMYVMNRKLQSDVQSKDTCFIL